MDCTRGNLSWQVEFCSCFTVAALKSWRSLLFPVNARNVHVKNVGATLPVLQILLVRLCNFFSIYSYTVPLTNYANARSHNVISTKLCNSLELSIVVCHLDDPWNEIRSPLVSTPSFQILLCIAPTQDHESFCYLDLELAKFQREIKRNESVCAVVCRQSLTVLWSHGRSMYETSPCLLYVYTGKALNDRQSCVLS